MRLPFSISTFLLSIFYICSCHTKTDKLTIAAASNMQHVLDTLVSKFEDRHQIKCQKVIASSGKITAQLSQGAPYDIFLSADTKYPNKLRKLNITVDTISIYAKGQLVLWSKDSIQNVQDLSKNNIETIVIANPITAPYGKATQELLQNLKMNINAKIINAESIAQVNHFIAEGSVDAGFTSLSSIKKLKLFQDNYWLKISPTLYPTINQGAICLNNKKTALQFKQFLFSQEAQKILKGHGYLPIE